MKYSLFKSIILSSALVFSMTSCDLDQLPNDSITTTIAWQKVDDAVKFRNGIYSLFKDVNGGLYTYTSDFQSDLFNATISYSNRGGDMHRWDFTAAQYDIEKIWKGNYGVINNCNNIICNIDVIQPEKDGDAALLNNIKGEAYLMRAICYHTLALRFAKDFEPGTAASEKGLPLVLNVDALNKPSRSSLDETYEQIKQDIKNARSLLTVVGEPNATYFTKDVLDLFEARVNLYMHNYAEAVKLTSGLLTKYSLAKDVKELGKMWLNDEGSEIVYRVFQSVDERVNDMTAYLYFNTGTKSFSPDFVPSQWVLDLYEDSDIRKQVYFMNKKITCMDVEKENIHMLNKFPGNPALQKKEYEYFNMPKIFRAAEAYLIAAEASFLNGNEPAAASFLNQLRTKRGASAVNAAGDALLKEIKNEWIREFIGEGQRLNDLKRWHDGMQRHSPQDQDVLMKGEGFISLSKEASDIRFVWEIPNNDLNANSNLEGNW